MSDPRGRRTLAENLDRLFDTIRPEGPKGRRYTNEEVATAIKQAYPGIRVGGAYLSALRKGTKRNPSTELLTALARFFGVPASYFLDDNTAAQTDAEIELAKVAHNLGVRKLALRALELSPEGLAAVTRIVEHVLESDPGARTRSSGHPPRSQGPGPAPSPPGDRPAER
ncbi:MAG TPA: helix-turn-helix transcriptional regulator [Streptomyces sp.]|uniref:helix-turn-helix transcriptional regulator n=1 Tax=Streptomyces sp. TaxID=1931 RepID=UPI002D579FC6|nr:helix-turn-helix transcriptional regulator [Streptomyces sp.]HZG05602.1 helix-turn-helix transcriptional regulator [Streptomyces sp.]